jgi:hypothetical protein
MNIARLQSTFVTIRVVQQEQDRKGSELEQIRLVSEVYYYPHKRLCRVHADRQNIYVRSRTIQSVNHCHYKAT